MITDRFKDLSARRWRGCMRRQMARMPANQARGLAWLLSQQNEALADGDLGRLLRTNETLARFIETAAVARERAAAALASCVEAPSAEGPAAADAVSPAPQQPPALVAEPAPKMLSDGGSESVALALPRPEEPQVHRYSISSVTLAEAYAYLTQRAAGRDSEPEFMLAVSGVEAGGVRTLERLIVVKMAHQSFGEASFDMQDFGRIAIALYEHGQYLHAVFHSHRFRWPTGPSTTDTRLQAMLEQTGYPAIQAVFSEDGFVRFFANQRRFAVEVYGTGVEPVDGYPDAFRITQFGTLPYPAAAAASRGRSDGVRPLPARAGR